MIAKIKIFITKTLNVFGYEIRKNSSNTSSVKEPFFHFRELLQGIKTPIIFDVGAYVGNTVKLFNTSFPKSHVHAFEPFSGSFTILKDRFEKTDQISLNNLALGHCRQDERHMYITKNRGSNSLLKPDKDANKYWLDDPLSIEEKILVETTTIDYYCEKNSIKEIHLLKIDVQGNEIEVLKGAEALLKSRKIKLIFTEISVALNYSGQTEMDELIKFLKDYNFKIFNFFKMKHNNGKLIESDILFYLE